MCLRHSILQEVACKTFACKQLLARSTWQEGPLQWRIAKGALLGVNWKATLQEAPCGRALQRLLAGGTLQRVPWQGHVVILCMVCPCKATLQDAHCQTSLAGGILQEVTCGGYCTGTLQKVPCKGCLCPCKAILQDAPCKPSPCKARTCKANLCKVSLPCSRLPCKVPLEAHPLRGTPCKVPSEGQLLRGAAFKVPSREQQCKT